MSGPYSQDLRHTDPKMLNPAYQPPMTRKDWQKAGAALGFVLLAGTALQVWQQRSAEQSALKQAFSALPVAQAQIGSVIAFSPRGFINTAALKVDGVITNQFSSGQVITCVRGPASGEGMLLERHMEVCRLASPPTP